MAHRFETGTLIAHNIYIQQAVFKTNLLNLNKIYIKTTLIWFKGIRITIVFFMLDEDRNDLHVYDIFDNNKI